MADRILSLVQAQGRTRARVETNALRVIARLVAAMLGGGWYDTARLAEFTEQVSAVVDAAQQQVGGVTAQFLDAVMAELDEEPRIPIVDWQLPAQLRTVEPAVEWQRPAEQFRYARSQGADEAAAQKVAATRAEVLVLDDIQAAQQHATVTRLDAFPQVTGYRRVIHPELSQGGTCGLCAVAADRVYRKSLLMPVHARCHCGVLPITKRHDPGSPINAADLQQLYDAAGSTGAADLKRTRFTVAEHSELGPQLVAA